MRKSATLQAISFLFPSIALRKELKRTADALKIEREHRDIAVEMEVRKRVASFGEAVQRISDLANTVRRHEMAMRHARSDLLAGAPGKAVAQFLIREVESAQSRVDVPPDTNAQEWAHAVGTAIMVMRRAPEMSSVPSTVIDSFGKILKSYAP